MLVYTCLNATLMETTCCGAFVYVFKIRDQSIMVNKVCVWYYHHEMILALHRHGRQRKYTICMSMSIKLSPVKWSSTAPIKPFTDEHQLCNSYTMGCPPELGDNPWALVSGLSPVQMDIHDITIPYHPYISVDLTHHEIFCAYAGNLNIL